MNTITSTSSSSSNEIILSYDNANKQIIVNCQGEQKNYSDFTTLTPTNLGITGNFNVFDIQQELRYLDSKKDLLGGTGMDDVVANAYGMKQNQLPSYNKLNQIKKAYTKQILDDNMIETKSWAKTDMRDSLDIKLGSEGDSYVFRESGYNINEDIAGGCIDMACFSNTILDPFVRSFSRDTQHFPPKNVSLIFDESFVNGLLKFVGCKLVKSILTSSNLSIKRQREDSESDGAQDEELSISVPSDKPRLIKRGRKNDEASVGGAKGDANFNYYYEISYENNINITGNITYPKSISEQTALNRYVIGNENKNAFLQTLSGKSKSDTDQKKIIIQVKEMGDVLQVFSMLAWFLCNSKDKKQFVMTTIDSIVFLLCIMFRLPCIVYEFKNEEPDENNPKKASKQKEEKGRTRYLLRYLPISFSNEDKIRQTIYEITTSNKKISTLISRIIDNNLEVYISKSYPIKVDTAFLNYIKYIIDLLTISVEHLLDETDNSAIRASLLSNIYQYSNKELTPEEINSLVTEKTQVYNSLITSIRSDIADKTREDYNDNITPFLQQLKINFMNYELFFNGKGKNSDKLYAATSITTLTQNRQKQMNHLENILFFPCNDKMRQETGKVSFAIWCQKHPQPTSGGSLMDSGEIQISVYEQKDESWTSQTVNMYYYLLRDIYDVLQKKLGTDHISDYLLYDIYILLAFHFNLCNEVYYPFDKSSELVERVGLPSLSGYLKEGQCFNYLDEFIDYIVDEYNDPNNGPGNFPLTEPNSPLFDYDITKSECVNNAFQNLSGVEMTIPEEISAEETTEATVVSDQGLGKGPGKMTVVPEEGSEKGQEKYESIMQKLESDVKKNNENIDDYLKLIEKLEKDDRGKGHLEPQSREEYVIELNENAEFNKEPLFEYLKRIAAGIMKRKIGEQGTPDTLSRLSTAETVRPRYSRESSEYDSETESVRTDDLPYSPESILSQSSIAETVRPGYSRESSEYDSETESVATIDEGLGAMKLDFSDNGPSTPRKHGGKNKSKKRVKSRKNKRTRRAKNKRTKKPTRKHAKKPKHRKSRRH
jgi:hypothetical protein